MTWVSACAFGSALLLCTVAIGCEAYLVDGGFSGNLGGEGSDGNLGVGGSGTVQDSCASFYEGFEPVPDVSFRQDLVPILRQNCNTSTCHGGAYDRAQAELWLGPNAEQEPTDDDLWFVYRSLIDIQSTVAPGLALVRRGDARASYFMRKLDDCHDPIGLECTLDPQIFDAPCGDAMPVLGARLSEQDRSLFRSWIENGAPEN